MSSNRPVTHLSPCFILFLFSFFFFFFNDTATTEIYTLSLHDALPISQRQPGGGGVVRRLQDDHAVVLAHCEIEGFQLCAGDRKSTRLNSSHGYISYAVFCLKKKKKQKKTDT